VHESTDPDPVPSHPAGKRSIVPTAALPAPKFRYSPVVVAGGFAFVSGLVGLDPRTGALVGGGAYAQSARILDNLSALCVEQGWSLGQLVVARIYCADFSVFPEVNRAWEERFRDVVPPARTSIGASALPLGALVEMEFQLALA
jgi:2-iminobutanoate/2-iminopropanoate deaminase